MTVEELIEKLQTMPKTLSVVDYGRECIEDVFEGVKYYYDGREEKVVVIY